MQNSESRQNAMDQLFDGLSNSSTTPSTLPSSAATKSNKPGRKKRQSEDEHITTIMPIELMNKLRYINAKEGIPLRELFALATKYLIKEYESKKGPIQVRKSKAPKTDASSIFDI